MEVAKWFVIRHDNGTYYADRSGIGPRFGATKAEAFKFASRGAAADMLADWRFTGCEIESVDGPSDG